MGDVLDLRRKVSRQSAARDRRRWDQHQAARLLIHRRALELAAEYQEHVFRRMLTEVNCGWLDPALIPYWQPVGLPQRKET